MKAPPDLQDRGGAVPEPTSKGTSKPTRFSDYERETISFLTGGKRTAWDGVDVLGSPNLRSVVAALQAKGVRIQREWFEFLNRRGKTVRARRYWIEWSERQRVLGDRQA